jgi:hypothetical protein
MRHSFSALLRLATVPVAIAGFVTLALPPQPAAARRQNDYQTCAAALSNSGIDAAQVAAACAAALRPDELATCVSQISGQATIAAPDALSGCRRVRRPLELATCVVSINPSEGAVATNVLDNCRRSLLPARFSECVVGLISEIDINTNRAMRSCIASTDPVQDGLPAGSEPVTQPATPEPIPQQVSPDSAPLPIPAPSAPSQP